MAFTDGQLLRASDLNNLEADLRDDINNLEADINNLEADINNLEADLLEAATKDTGLRNISALIEDRQSGQMLLQRIGNTVQINMVNFIFSSGYVNGVKYQLPQGFRPPNQFVWSNTPDMTIGPRILISSIGNITVFSLPAGQGLYSQVNYLTSDQWPLTLPGTPA